MLGGLVGALFPFRFWLETKGSLEQVYVALALLLAIIATGRAWRSHDEHIGSSVWRGILWATAILCSASLLPVCLLLLGVEVCVINRSNVGIRVRDAAVLILTTGLLLLPWTARNYYQFKKVFLIRDNLGLELAVSNNDFAKPLLDENVQMPQYHHPGGSVSEALKVQQVGEIAYNQEQMRDAVGWIRSHPLAFLRLTLLRIWYFWFPKMQRISQTVAYGFLTLLGLAGGWQAIRRRREAAWLIFSVWAAFPLIYYVIESADRYRYPIDWLILITAAYCVDLLVLSGHSVEPLPAPSA